MTIEERNQLVTKNINLANYLAVKQYKKYPWISLDELKSAAYYGLLKAAINYNDKYSFSSYASKRIVFEMKDHLRAWRNYYNRNKILLEI